MECYCSLNFIVYKSAPYPQCTLYMYRYAAVQLPVDKGSEWILSVARHRDPLADPVGMLRHAEIDLD